MMVQQTAVLSLWSTLQKQVHTPVSLKTLTWERPARLPRAFLKRVENIFCLLIWIRQRLLKSLINFSRLQKKGLMLLFDLATGSEEERLSLGKSWQTRQFFFAVFLSAFLILPIPSAGSNCFLKNPPKIFLPASKPFTIIFILSGVLRLPRDLTLSFYVLPKTEGI